MLKAMGVAKIPTFAHIPLVNEKVCESVPKLEKVGESMRM